MTALHAIALLLALQLAGEMIVTALSLPIPGPVLGMALLFAGLAIRERRMVASGQPEGSALPEALDRVTGMLLQNLSLLFVPAGVGVVVYIDVIAEGWLPIIAALIASTLLTIALVAVLFARLAPAPDPADVKGAADD
ncbi:MAG: hypothetical protein Alpg2KO_16740 [Alphaproteobacteria bacterium]